MFEETFIVSIYFRICIIFIIDIGAIEGLNQLIQNLWPIAWAFLLMVTGCRSQPIKIVEDFYQSENEITASF